MKTSNVIGRKEDSRQRLANRIKNCKDQIDVQMMRIRNASKERIFWMNELQAAEAEFHGYTQGQLNLLNCPTCGD